MNTVETSLAQHFDEIVTAVEALLEDARAGTLSDVTNINRGDRALVNEIEPPVLWIFPGGDTIDQSGGQATVHNIEIVIVAVVGGVDPRAGFAAASNLAARAYDVLLSDRTWRNTVHDVIPVRFDPATERFRSKALYAAAAVFSGRVRRRG